MAKTDFEAMLKKFEAEAKENKKVITAAVAVETEAKAAKAAAKAVDKALVEEEE